ncbi:MAG: SDR family oxidoreductase [Solirubrobacteraceae bacterium]
MRVFVTGASGHIGSAVVPELLSAGHQVIGLARSDASAAALEAAGAEVRRGDLDDLEDLADGAATADGVIHLAYKHDWMRTGDFQGAVDADLRAVTAIGAALEGSGKPFVGTSGTGMLALGGITDRPGTERDVLDGGPRIDAENHVIALAQRGVRSSVVRLPPLVHSTLDHHGFGPSLIAIARDKGLSGYVGDGSNRWPAVHTLDAARVYRLALEVAPAGTRLHAIGDDGVPFRDIAVVIGTKLGVPTASIAPEAAAEHFAFLGRFVSMDNPTSDELTRALLDWAPTHPGLVEDLEDGHYFEEPRARALAG